MSRPDDPRVAAIAELLAAAGVRGEVRDIPSGARTPAEVGDRPAGAVEAVPDPATAVGP